MHYEVERKYRIVELPALSSRLAELGAKPVEIEAQEDCYYAHPARDFAKTDEALRLRRAGADNQITYKGPKLDSQSKTRRELELALPPGDRALADFGQLLEALSFRPVATVRKRRSKTKLEWHGQDVEIAIDDVDQLGLFIELEIGANDAGLRRAERLLASLAEKLQLDGAERRSYLELLLAAKPGPSP